MQVLVKLISFSVYLSFKNLANKSTFCVLGKVKDFSVGGQLCDRFTPPPPPPRCSSDGHKPVFHMPASAAVHAHI